VERGRIWGYERAYARSYPQIRVSATENPNDPAILLQISTEGQL
jgi:hypothetical protein